MFAEQLLVSLFLGGVEQELALFSFPLPWEEQEQEQAWVLKQALEARL